MARREELTDEQWAIIEPLIPPHPRREDGRGRAWKDTREVPNGILWILRSGRGGKIYRAGSRRTRPATADSSSGREAARCAACLKLLPQTSKYAATSTCRNASSSARSWSLKKGIRSGKDQAGQRMDQACRLWIICKVLKEGASHLQ
jgi:transposase